MQLFTLTFWADRGRDLLRFFDLRRNIDGHTIKLANHEDRLDGSEARIAAIERALLELHPDDPALSGIRRICPICSGSNDDR